MRADGLLGYLSKFGIGVDWQGRCTTNTADYAKLVDPGDGSFLRWTNDVSRCRASFAGGVVTYSDASKTALLGVTADVIRKHGAVSRETARAMVDGGEEGSQDYEGAAHAAHARTTGGEDA